VARSAQTSGQITGRFCRDIDGLIAKRDMKRVVERAIAHNYKMVVDTEPFEVVESRSDQRFFTRYAEVVTLISPDNVTIEVHRKLTKLSLKFDDRKIFSTSDRISISGVEMQTLSPALHFVYICYHHSRHFWSRLHWLTDIDGFLRDKNTSKQEVMQIAEEVGIAPTVAATYEFYELLAQPERWNKPEVIGSHGGQYLVACLANLRGGLEVEKELRQNMTLGDFMSSWQVSSSRYNEMWINSWFHRLKPSITQHLARRYPPYLQWVYYIENVLSLARNAFNLARPGARKATQQTTAK